MWVGTEFGSRMYGQGQGNKGEIRMCSLCVAAAGGGLSLPLLCLSCCSTPRRMPAFCVLMLYPPLPSSSTLLLLLLRRSPPPNPPARRRRRPPPPKTDFETETHHSFSSSFLAPRRPRPRPRPPRPLPIPPLVDGPAASAMLYVFVGVVCAWVRRATCREVERGGASWGAATRSRGSGASFCTLSHWARPLG